MRIWTVQHRCGGRWLTCGAIFGGGRMSRCAQRPRLGQASLAVSHTRYSRSIVQPLGLWLMRHSWQQKHDAEFKTLIEKARPVKAKVLREATVEEAIVIPDSDP